MGLATIGLWNAGKNGGDLRWDRPQYARHAQWIGDGESGCGPSALGSGSEFLYDPRADGEVAVCQSIFQSPAKGPISWPAVLSVFDGVIFCSPPGCSAALCCWLAVTPIPTPMPTRTAPCPVTVRHPAMERLPVTVQLLVTQRLPATPTERSPRRRGGLLPA